MQTRFHLFIRQHPNDWYTASVLNHPRCAAFGPALPALKAQLAEMVAVELSAGRISRNDNWFDDIGRRAVELELRAVQHDRLIRVPMRFTLVVRPLPKVGDDVFEVRIPRLNQVFRIVGEDNIVPWSEEMIRGFFHLDPVEDLLPYQSARGERLDFLDVTWQQPKSKVARKRAARRVAAEEADDPFGFAQHRQTPLSAVGVELVAEAREGRIERAELRDGLVEQLVGILGAGHAGSMLLVGPAGVGKTTLVHEVAHRIAAGKVPVRLMDIPVWHITGGRIVAGMKYLGEWQARCQAIVEEIRSERGILFVGSPYELMTAGDTGSGMSVAHFLLGPIRSGEITVIAESTPDGLLLAEQTHPAFIEALRRVPIPPFDPDDARSILGKAATRFEKTYKVNFTPPGLSRAMDVLARFGDADSLPGSGIALIEQMARLPSESAKKGRTRPELGPKDAVRAFARRSGFGETLIDPDVLLDADGVSAWFGERIIGQADATALLTNLVLVIKASLDDPQRPLGSFLFMGPTGVGKTESALTLAQYLFGDRERVIRFDMSEYGYPGSSARLVGVGRQEGDLTRRVREQPFCVLLLDEVEKADGEVFDILLQVLGEGRLTDGTGRTVRFNHAIVIMTSNLGASDKRRIGLGGTEQPDDLARHYREAAQAYFRPEFINRVDFLVPFAPLDADAVRGIARRMLDSALDREGFSRRGITVRAGDDVIDLLMTHGFDPRYGARPMKRAVEQRVLVPLSRRLIVRRTRDDAPEAFDLYVHAGRVAVVSDRRHDGGPCPRLSGLAADNDAVRRRHVDTLRARLAAWDESPVMRAARDAGTDLPARLEAATTALASLDAEQAMHERNEEPTDGTIDGIHTMSTAFDESMIALEWDLCLTHLGGVDAIALEVESPSLHPAGRAAARTLARQYVTWLEGRGGSATLTDDGGVWRVDARGPGVEAALGTECGRHRLEPMADDERAVDVLVRRAGTEAPDAVVRSFAAEPEAIWDPVTGLEEAIGLGGLASALDRFIAARMYRLVTGRA